MERIIERDPAIAAKILRVANSSYYGTDTVPTIGRALSVLGLNTVRQLVVNIGFQQMVSGRQQSVLFDKLRFWKHSLAVAAGARILAKIKLPLKSEELYCAGMLHDIGMLVLDRFNPDALDCSIRCSREMSIPLFQAERNLFGYDHTAVGALLAEKWQLSPLITSAIRFHHNVLECEDDMEPTCIVAAADTLAHQCGLFDDDPDIDHEMDLMVQHNLDLPTEQLVIVGKVMYDEVQKAQQAFQIAA